MAKPPKMSTEVAVGGIWRRLSGTSSLGSVKHEESNVGLLARVRQSLR